MLAAAILLSGCAASSSNHSAGSDPGADRTLPTGTYLKRRSGQAPDASTVDKQQLENMPYLRPKEDASDRTIALVGKGPYI